MRVFTDGACSSNGRPGAKAGYAVWFPEHKPMSMSQKVPASHPQTNQRAEMAAIHHATLVLEENGFHDEDIVVYTDSDYSINCLTKWITGWVSRGWKTAAGSDVLHRDLIEDTSKRLAKFKSYRFVHVRSHTGGEDDLSRNNDIVDRMARATIDDTVQVTVPSAEDEIFPGCPLRLLGAPIAQSAVVAWMRENLSSLDGDIVDKHLFKAMTELCKTRDVTLTKQTIQRTPMIRAGRTNLQIDRVSTGND
jgi:ribonuclease HI